MGFNRTGKVTKRAPSSNIWGINLGKDIGVGNPCYFVWLHDFTDFWKVDDDEANNGNLPVHYIKGQFKPPLCNTIYFEEGDEDEHCEYDDAGSEPALVKKGVVYCFNFKGEKKPTADGTKEVNVPCVRTLEIGAGGNAAPNFAYIAQAQRAGCLSTFSEGGRGAIWVTSKKERGIEPPRPLSDLEIKMLGKGFDPEVPKEVLDQFRELKAGDFMGIVLDSYGNVKKDHAIFADLNIVWPSNKVKEEEGDKDSKGKSPSKIGKAKVSANADDMDR